MIEQSEPAPKKQDSKVVLVFATVGMFVGAAALRVVGADFYQPPPSGQFDTAQVALSAVGGALGALVGGGVGWLVEWPFKRS
jgi:hypothetical protein